VDLRKDNKQVKRQISVQGLYRQYYLQYLGLDQDIIQREICVILNGF